MTKHNFYIITGGPGGGKTSLLESLARKGYNYVPETARQMIKERLSKGLSPRPEAKAFACEIFEKDWTNFVTNSALSSLLFFDRCILDSAYQLFECDKASYNRIRDTHLKNRYNNKVFVTPPWREIYRNDSERDQSFEESIGIYERLLKWYRDHDYNVVILPKDTIESREKFVLSHIRD